MEALSLFKKDKQTKEETGLTSEVSDLYREDSKVSLPAEREEDIPTPF